MAGRIEIDDVAPVVSGGRFPAKAVVGEVVPVRATVWREGHDAVAATLVVRYHGTAYPQLAEAPAPAVDAGTGADRGGGQPGAADQTAAAADVAGPHARRLPRPVHPRQRRPVDVPGGRLGRPDRHLAQDVTAKLDAGQGEAELSNDLLIGARLLERAATGVPRKLRYPLIEAAAALRKPGDPFTRAGAALSPDVDRAARRSIRCANWSPAASNTASGWIVRWPGSAPGTSSSRGPPAAGTAKGNPVHGTFATAAKALPRIAKMGFDVVYLPPIHPIGKVHRKGRNNTRDRRARRCRLAVGDRQRRGRPRRRAPGAGHHRGLRRLRRRRPRPGHGGGAGPGAAVRAGPPVGQGASGVVHRAARRHHRLRGEPAEEVPGHLPAQLRQRPGRILRRGAAGGAVLDSARRQDLSGRQPAHQAAELLGVADRRGEERRPRRAVPGRGVHPAGPPVRAGQARLHPVLHVLHLAHREVGAHRVRRADRRARRLRPAEPVRQHARHPAREPAARRSGHVRDPGGAGRRR